MCFVEFSTLAVTKNYKLNSKLSAMFALVITTSFETIQPFT